MFLFNDRYGLQRIYYHEHSTGFYFSSEAKALLKVLPELRELDLGSLAETFSFGCVLGNRTLFPKIALLPGGSRWTFEGKRIVKRETYFEPLKWETQEPLTDVGYYDSLKETFCRILPKYFRGTGTRNVAYRRAGWSHDHGMGALPPGTLPCYTFGGTYRDCADVTIARHVAKLCASRTTPLASARALTPSFPAWRRKPCTSPTARWT